MKTAAKLILPALLLSWSSCPLLLVRGSCPKDTETFTSGSTERCFRIGQYHDRVNFDEYKKNCKELKGKTLTVDSRDVIDYFNSIDKSRLSDYWIGAVMSEGYIWKKTGEEVTENLWHKPQSSKSSEEKKKNCVALTDGRWELMDCDKKKVDNYVCEKESTGPECKRISGRYFDFVTNICYQVFYSRKIRHDVAERKCQSAGSRLARIDTKQKATHAIFSKSKKYWIGMKLANADSYTDWHWTASGEGLNFTNWQAQPNSYHMKCANAKRRYGERWFTRPCSESKGWVCEVKGRPDKPSITENGGVTRAVWVNRGMIFTLKCRRGASGPIPNSWMWYKDGTRIELKVKGATFTKSAVEDDAGTYICMALSDGTKSQPSDPTELTVNVPPHRPVITVGSKPMTATAVNLGETLALACSKGPGGPTPDSWKWFKEGKIVSNGNLAQRFSKSATVAGDAGSYKCQAFKGGLASPISETLTLTVNVPPDKPVITVGNKPLTTTAVDYGKALKLMCSQAQGGPAPDSWKWFRDGTLILGGNSAQSFSKNAAEAGDAGSYKCQAFKGGWSSVMSETLALAVNVPPDKPVITVGNKSMTTTAVDYGKALTLTCSKAQNGPAPDSWKWFRDGTLILGGNSAQRFSTTSTETGDAGSYKCQAFKGGLSSVMSETLTLAVNVPPDKPSIKVGNTIPRSLKVGKGETFSLTCTKGLLAGSTPDLWTWYKDGSPFRTGVTGATFTKTAVTSDAGSYTCNAHSKGLLSVSSSALALTVIDHLGKPVIMEGGTTKTRLTVDLGDTVTLVCSKGSGGSSPDTWIWYVDNHLISSATEATLTKNATADDAGSYTCKACRGRLISPVSDALTLTVNVKCQIDIYGRKYQKFKDTMLANTRLKRINHNSRSVLHCITACLNLHQCDCSAVEYSARNRTCTMIKAVADLARQPRANAPGLDLLLLK